MSTPQFNTKEEFEAYLNNTSNRLETEASVRQQKALLFAIPIGILVAVLLFVVPGMIGDWAAKSDILGAKAHMEESIKEREEMIKHSQAKAQRKQREFTQGIQDQREEMLRNFTRTHR